MSLEPIPRLQGEKVRQLWSEFREALASTRRLDIGLLVAILLAAAAMAFFGGCQIMDMLGKSLLGVAVYLLWWLATMVILVVLMAINFRVHERLHAKAATWVGIPRKSVFVLPGVTLFRPPARLRDLLVILLAPVTIILAAFLAAGVPLYLLVDSLWGGLPARLFAASWSCFAVANIVVSVEDLGNALRAIRERRKGQANSPPPPDSADQQQGQDQQAC
jgi:hypothetical protein